MVVNSASLPIIVVEGMDDVYVYPTIDAAALSLEPWWVEEKRGAVYDAQGRLLLLAVSGNNVEISLGEIIPNHSSELREILRSFLNGTGRSQDGEHELGLEKLVELCDSD